MGIGPAGLEPPAGVRLEETVVSRGGGGGKKFEILKKKIFSRIVPSFFFLFPFPFTPTGL